MGRLERGLLGRRVNSNKETMQQRNPERGICQASPFFVSAFSLCPFCGLFLFLVVGEEAASSRHLTFRFRPLCLSYAPFYKPYSLHAHHIHNTGTPMNECPLCRASAGDGLSCAGCVKNTLYYKQQAIAYKKLALRDAYEQAKVVLTARQPIFEEEQAVADLMRRQGEMRRRLQEVGRGLEGGREGRRESGPCHTRLTGDPSLSIPHKHFLILPLPFLSYY